MQRLRVDRNRKRMQAKPRVSSEKRLAMLEDAILRLHEAGYYPSVRAISHEMGVTCRGFTKAEAELRDKAFKELGIKMQCRGKAFSLKGKQ